MPNPIRHTTETKFTQVHEVRTRIPDWFDFLTLLLPIIIPLFTFWLGYKLNDRVENRKESKRLKRIEKYFLASASSLISIIDDQAESIRKSAKKIKSTVEDVNVVNIKTSLNTTKLKSVSDLDLYEILARSKSSSDMSDDMMIDFSISLEYIDGAKARMKSFNEEFFKEKVRYIDKLNIAYTTLGEETDALYFIHGHEINIEDKELLKLHLTIIKHIAEYNERVETEELSFSDIHKRYEYLIKPLFQEASSIERIQSTNSRMTVIGNLKQDYDYFYSQVDKSEKFLNDLATKLNKAANAIRSVCAYIRNEPTNT